MEGLKSRCSGHGGLYSRLITDNTGAGITQYYFIAIKTSMYNQIYISLNHLSRNLNSLSAIMV